MSSSASVAPAAPAEPSLTSGHICCPDHRPQGHRERGGSAAAAAGLLLLLPLVAAQGRGPQLHMAAERGRRGKGLRRRRISYWLRSHDNGDRSKPHLQDGIEIASVPQILNACAHVSAKNASGCLRPQGHRIRNTWHGFGGVVRRRVSGLTPGGPSRGFDSHHPRQALVVFS